MPGYEVCASNGVAESITDSPFSFPSPTQIDVQQKPPDQGLVQQQRCSGTKTGTQPLIIGVSGLFVYGKNSSGVQSHTTSPESSTFSLALLSAGSRWKGGGNQDPGTTEAPPQPAPPAGRGLTHAATRAAAIQTARHSPRPADWPAASAAPRGLPGTVVPAEAARRTPDPRPARGGRPAAPAGGGARAGREPPPPHPRLPGALRTVRRDEGERPRCLRASRGWGGVTLPPCVPPPALQRGPLSAPRRASQRRGPFPHAVKGRGRLTANLAPFPGGRIGIDPPRRFPAAGEPEAARTKPRPRNGGRAGGMGAWLRERETEVKSKSARNGVLLVVFNKPSSPSGFFFPSAALPPGTARPGAGRGTG